jgi:hypothetical protein
MSIYQDTTIYVMDEEETTEEAITVYKEMILIHIETKKRPLYTMIHIFRNNVKAMT